MSVEVKWEKVDHENFDASGVAGCTFAATPLVFVLDGNYLSSSTKLGAKARLSTRVDTSKVAHDDDEPQTGPTAIKVCSTAQIADGQDDTCKDAALLHPGHAAAVAASEPESKPVEIASLHYSEQPLPFCTVERMLGQTHVARSRPQAEDPVVGMAAAEPGADASPTDFAQVFVLDLTRCPRPGALRKEVEAKMLMPLLAIGGVLVWQTSHLTCGDDMQSTAMHAFSMMQEARVRCNNPSLTNRLHKGFVTHQDGENQGAREANANGVSLVMAAHSAVADLVLAELRRPNENTLFCYAHSAQAALTIVSQLDDKLLWGPNAVHQMHSLAAAAHVAAIDAACDKARAQAVGDSLLPISRAILRAGQWHDKRDAASRLHLACGALRTLSDTLCETPESSQARGTAGRVLSDLLNLSVGQTLFQAAEPETVALLGAGVVAQSRGLGAFPGDDTHSDAGPPHRDPGGAGSVYDPSDAGSVVSSLRGNPPSHPIFEPLGTVTFSAALQEAISWGVEGKKLCELPEDRLKKLLSVSGVSLTPRYTVWMHLSELVWRSDAGCSALHKFLLQWCAQIQQECAVDGKSELECALAHALVFSCQENVSTADVQLASPKLLAAVLRTLRGGCLCLMDAWRTQACRAATSGGESAVARIHREFAEIWGSVLSVLQHGTGMESSEATLSEQLTSLSAALKKDARRTEQTLEGRTQILNLLLFVEALEAVPGLEAFLRGLRGSDLVPCSVDRDTKLWLTDMITQTSSSMRAATSMRPAARTQEPAATAGGGSSVPCTPPRQPLEARDVQRATLHMPRNQGDVTAATSPAGLGLFSSSSQHPSAYATPLRSMHSTHPDSAASAGGFSDGASPSSSSGFSPSPLSPQHFGGTPTGSPAVAIAAERDRSTRAQLDTPPACAADARLREIYCTPQDAHGQCIRAFDGVPKWFTPERRPVLRSREAGPDYQYQAFSEKSSSQCLLRTHVAFYSDPARCGRALSTAFMKDTVADLIGSVNETCNQTNTRSLGRHNVYVEASVLVGDTLQKVRGFAMSRNRALEHMSLPHV